MVLSGRNWESIRCAPGHVDGVLQVALHFVEDVLGGAAEQDGARLRILALLDEGEVLVTDFTDLKNIISKIRAQL
jgi:hypothetical protein